MATSADEPGLALAIGQPFGETSPGDSRGRLLLKRMNMLDLKPAYDYLADIERRIAALERRQITEDLERRITALEAKAIR